MTQFYLDLAVQALPLIGGAVIGYLWEKKKGADQEKEDMKKDIDEQREALTKAVRAVCKIELRRIYDNGKANGGKVSREDWQDADEIYTAYHGMGGNGRGTEIIKKIHEMALS